MPEVVMKYPVIVKIDGSEYTFTQFTGSEMEGVRRVKFGRGPRMGEWGWEVLDHRRGRLVTVHEGDWIGVDKRRCFAVLRDLPPEGWKQIEDRINTELGKESDKPVVVVLDDGRVMFRTSTGEVFPLSTMEKLMLKIGVYDLEKLDRIYNSNPQKG